MTRADAIARLAADADGIRAMGVRHLYLIGSTARDEAAAASDVDILVEQDLDRFGIMQLLGLKERLTRVLGVPADIATRDGLHPILRPTIEADAVSVF